MPAVLHLKHIPDLQSVHVAVTAQDIASDTLTSRGVHHVCLRWLRSTMQTCNEICKAVAQLLVAFV